MNDEVKDRTIRCFVQLAFKPSGGAHFFSSEKPESMEKQLCNAMDHGKNIIVNSVPKDDLNKPIDRLGIRGADMIMFNVSPIVVGGISIVGPGALSALRSKQ